MLAFATSGILAVLTQCLSVGAKIRVPQINSRGNRMEGLLKDYQDHTKYADTFLINSYFNRI